MLPTEVGKLRDFARKGEANAAVLNGLQKDVLAVKRDVAELLLVAEKARDVRLDAEKKVDLL